MRPRTRRSLLGLTASGTVAALAGCLDDSDGSPATTAPSTTEGAGEPGQTTTEETTPTTDDADDDNGASGDATATVDGLERRNWLPSPEAIGSDPYWVYAADAAIVRERQVSTAAEGRIKEYFYGIPESVLSFDDAGPFVTIGGSMALSTYTLETETVREQFGSQLDPETVSIPEAGAAPTGYELYEVGDGVIWLGADHLLFAPSHEPIAQARAAADGDLDRYGETTDLGAALDAMGDADVWGGRATSQQIVEDATAFLYAWQLGSNDADFRSVFTFESAGSVDDEQLSTLTDEDGFAEYGDFEITTDGRVATLEASIQLDEFDLLERENDSSGGTEAPQVSFDFDFDTGSTAEWDGEDAETIEIVHNGGDSVALTEIEIGIGSASVDELDGIESTPPSGETWAAGGVWSLSPTTDGAVSSGDTLRVIWRSSSGDTSAVLAMVELP